MVSIFVFPFWSIKETDLDKRTKKKRNEKTTARYRQIRKRFNIEKFWRTKNHYFKQQNEENLLFITEKNNKLNKILIEGVVGKQVCCRVCVFLFLLVSAR